MIKGKLANCILTPLSPLAPSRRMRASIYLFILTLLPPTRGGEFSLILTLINPHYIYYYYY
jgi:hypothetical protein